MAEEIISENELLLKAVRCFQTEFGGLPEKAACAPGRVNLIGEHTDYNDGYVLPVALPLITIVVGRKNNLDQCRIKTLAEGIDKPNFTEFTIPSKAALKPGLPKWANYVKGVVQLFRESVVPGFDAVIVSTVPVGGGLSSSAALEVSTYTFLENLTSKMTESLEVKALTCQKAEHEFAGVPCGIMDQFISTKGTAGSALLIDCRIMASVLVPIKADDLVLVIINSNVKHELAGGEYALRRKQCKECAEILGKNSLRDATVEELITAKKNGKLPDLIFQRGHHAVSEIARTKQASDCLLSGDIKSFGQLMYFSHTSLSKDYEVSCRELDELVEIAMSVDGVIGSRMTGGGFGGCTITLVDKKAVDKLITEVKAKYSGTPTIYIVKPSSGARQMTLEGLS